MKYRKFTQEFKKKVVEECLTGILPRTAVCRKYSIAPIMFYRWQKQYLNGKLDMDFTREKVLEERIKELERKIGELTMDNELLKKAIKHSLETQEKKESLSPVIYPLSEQLQEDVEL